MKAVLAGGGRPFEPTESLPLVLTALNLTGISKPNVLIVPGAPSSEDLYLEDKHGLLAILGPMLGWNNVDVLCGFGETPTRTQIEDKLDGVHLVIGTGGNYPQFLAMARNSGLDKILPARATDPNDPLVIYGTSTTLNCWFREALSDPRTREQTEAKQPRDFEALPGWSVLPALGCAHANRFHSTFGYSRDERFRKLVAVRPAGTIGIGLNDDTGLVIINDTARIQARDSRDVAHRYVSDGFDGTEVKLIHPSDGEFKLSQLLTA
jgi:peptidase E